MIKKAHLRDAECREVAEHVQGQDLEDLEGIVEMESIPYTLQQDIDNMAQQI